MKRFTGTYTALAVILMGAGSASAQAVSCGGIGDGAAWIGGDAASSDVSTSQGPLLLSGVTVPANGQAVALFSVSEQASFRVEAAGSDPFGDTVLEVYDEAGVLVVTDDDSGGNLASRAEVPLPVGQYCLAARGFGGSSIAADLQVGRLEHEALTEGLAGSFSDTNDLPPFVGVEPCLPGTEAVALGNGALDGALATGGVLATNTISGAPYYRFTLTTPQSLSVTAENPSADPYIYIFDGTGALLAENDDFDGLNSRVDFTSPLAAGTYCIGMRSLSDPNVPVTVAVAAFDAEAALVAEYASGDVAPPLNGSYPVIDLGALPNQSIRDAQVTGGQATFYAMEIDAPGLLLINADDVRDSDPVITFFDAGGTMIAQNDDSNGTFDSELVVRVEPGRYTLGVRQFSDSAFGIIRITMQRYVPAP